MVRIFYGLAVLLLTFGCTSKKERKQPTETAPAAAPTVGEIHFFLETSASMGGYLRGATEFKDVVSDWVTKANTVKPVKVWTVSEKAQPYGGDSKTFVETLATTPLATGKSSRLHLIFDQVGQRAKGNNIAILVSDCILSFPDADVRNNPDINQQNASSVLKNQIYDQFVKLNRQGIGTTVYAYQSKYNGTYYDFQNKKQALNGETRPFYVWVIGKQDVLGLFNNQIRDLLSSPPAKELSFGKTSANGQYDILFSLNRKGKWKAGKAEISEMTARAAKPEEFAVGVNLSGLPSYAQAESYIRTNLKLTSPNAAVKLVGVQTKEDIPNIERMKPNELKLLNKNTHVLTFRVDNFFDDPATVDVRLPVKFDNWYEQAWSTMDDRTAAGRRNKTFALQHLMGGVREAYQSAGNDFLQFSITLKKD